MTVAAAGSNITMGDDEILVRSVSGGVEVLVISEGPGTRLQSDSDECTPVRGRSASIICSAAVTAIFIDYRPITSATTTVVLAPMDTVFQGGSGDDYFQGGPGNDKIYGNAGNDTLFADDEDGPYGDDLVDGGPGRDIIDGMGGTNYIFARDGERDTRVECATRGVPGAVGYGEWDIDLDVPINCLPIPIPEDLPPVSFLQVQPTWDSRSGMNLVWGAPEAPLGTRIADYEIERSVSVGAGDYVQLATVRPNQLRYVDPCVPFGVLVFYRVRAQYEAIATGLVSVGAWRGVQNFNPAIPTRAFDAQMNYTGMQETPSGPATRPSIEMALQSTLPQVSECFGVRYLVEVSSTGNRDRELPPFQFLGQFPQTRGSGEREDLRQQFLLWSVERQRFVSARVTAFWVIDDAWRDRYGFGYPSAVAGAMVSAQRDINRPNVLITSGVFTNDAGVRVNNLNARWGANDSIQVSWQPPSNFPGITNMRGYEVCTWTNSNSTVYTANYPPVQNMYCQVVRMEARSLSFTASQWCSSADLPVGDNCAALRSQAYVQVRPWVGNARVELLSPGTAWRDWNRHTWVTARPTSTRAASMVAQQVVSPAAAPNLGDCVKDPDPSNPQSSATTIACTQPHNVEIFAVGTASDDLGVPSQAVVTAQQRNDWCTPPGGTTVVPVILDHLGVPGATIALRRSFNIQLPTDEQWLAGERWVGCGVSVLNQTTRTYESWSGTAAAKTAAEGAGWLLACTPDRPTSGATYAGGPCASAGFVLVDSVVASGAAGTPYPGAALQARAEDECRPIAQEWLRTTLAPGDSTGFAATLPSQAAWDAGNRTVQCWIPFTRWPGQVTNAVAPSPIPADAMVTLDGPTEAAAAVPAEFRVSAMTAAGNPLVSAPITVTVSGAATVGGGGREYGGVTDALGEFEFEVMPGARGTFTVRAGLPGMQSASVTASITSVPVPSATITITGKGGRVGKKAGVIIAGTVEGLAPRTMVVPHFRVQGTKSFKKAKPIRVSEQGTIRWRRASGKPVTVFMKSGETTSNRVTVRPRR